MQQVSTMIGNLRNMATDMGTEVGNQNSQLDRINLKVKLQKTKNRKNLFTFWLRNISHFNLTNFTKISKILILQIYFREPRTNLVSRWPMIGLVDYSSKKNVVENSQDVLVKASSWSQPITFALSTFSLSQNLFYSITTYKILFQVFALYF